MADPVSCDGFTYYQPTAYGSCLSDPTEVTAQPGMGVVHMQVPASCP
jgi:hypothetical protein